MMHIFPPTTVATGALPYHISDALLSYATLLVAAPPAVVAEAAVEREAGGTGREASRCSSSSGDW